MVDLCYKDSNITVALLGGGAGGCVRGRLRTVIFLLVLGCFCCNSYVGRSIELCMYVDSAKFNLTP